MEGDKGGYMIYTTHLCHVEKQAIEAIWNLYDKAILQACFEVWNMILVSNVDYAKGW